MMLLMLILSAASYMEWVEETKEENAKALEQITRIQVEYANTIERLETERALSLGNLAREVRRIRDIHGDTHIYHRHLRYLAEEDQYWTNVLNSAHQYYQSMLAQYKIKPITPEVEHHGWVDNKAMVRVYYSGRFRSAGVEDGEVKYGFKFSIEDREVTWERVDNGQGREVSSDNGD